MGFSDVCYFVKHELNQKQKEAVEGCLWHTEWPFLTAALMEMTIIKPPVFVV